MCVCSPETLVKNSERPKINGIEIAAIYSKKLYVTGSTDAYTSKETDFYLCVPWYGYITGKPFKIKTLPPVFAALFGKQKYKDRTLDITHISFRESDSSNGSFTDETMEISDGNNRSFTIYRGCPYMIKHGAVDPDSSFGKKMLATLGSKSNAELCPEGFASYYPQTPIQRVGRFVYPDAAQPSWRWLSGGRPYVTINHADQSNIRVYHEEYKAHLYLEQVIPQKGDEGLIRCKFSYEQNADTRCNKGFNFVQLSEWTENKKEDPGGIIRWRILRMKRDKKSVEVAAVINDKIQFREESWMSNYYRLNSMVKI